MKIAVFTKNRLNPAYAGARLGAERAAAAAGAEVAHYVPDTPDDASEQLALIDRALQTRPDAIVLVPVHPSAVGSGIARINAAGIPLIACISRPEAGELVSFIGSDDHALAFAIAQYVSRHLGGEGDVVLIDGPPESTTTAPRAKGFRDAVARHPGIRVAGTCVGRYLYEPARAAVTALLPSTGSIDAVLAANDLMALGALDALRAAGRTAVIAGVNAIPEAVAAIKRGDLLVSADFSAMNIGYLAAEAAIRHLRGETVPREIMLPVELVDRANCARWDLPYAERTCPAWEDVVANGGGTT